MKLLAASAIEVIGVMGSHPCGGVELEEPREDVEVDEEEDGLVARFDDLPKSPIYTMHHHVPENWLTGPVKSVYDLDNIKLESIEGEARQLFSNYCARVTVICSNRVTL